MKNIRKHLTVSVSVTVTVIALAVGCGTDITEPGAKASGSLDDASGGLGQGGGDDDASSGTGGPGRPGARAKMVLLGVTAGSPTTAGRAAVRLRTRAPAAAPPRAG